MTAKEALHDAVEAMDEAEAERWLAVVRRIEPPKPEDALNAPTLADLVEAAFGDVPGEEFAKWPRSDRVDEVLRQQVMNQHKP